VGRTRRRLQTKDLSGERDFARGMVEYPIAINTREANDQHYELPPEFFSLMLGPQRK
jgi:cyclopropane-fatty-acyl-phospholipid synthase